MSLVSVKANRYLSAQTLLKTWEYSNSAQNSGKLVGIFSPTSASASASVALGVGPATGARVKAPLEEGCCGWVGPRFELDTPRVNS